MSGHALSRYQTHGSSRVSTTPWHGGTVAKGDDTPSALVTLRGEVTVLRQGLALSEGIRTVLESDGRQTPAAVAQSQQETRQAIHALRALREAAQRERSAYYTEVAALRASLVDTSHRERDGGGGGQRARRRRATSKRRW